MICSLYLAKLFTYSYICINNKNNYYLDKFNFNFVNALQKTDNKEDMQLVDPEMMAIMGMSGFGGGKN